ncbi:hypothetical protein JG688_00015044 [Phytophthora aleatoria]|uniref:Uncharacterized protein n=1 Tax=Phytophthora aleatoria TaxID=2496075 RepID=A0A8J5I6G0_9STRA|nr:hypothetical protein JG688_00015044 [Phytophthora aleatoria]
MSTTRVWPSVLDWIRWRRSLRKISAVQRGSRSEKDFCLLSPLRLMTGTKDRSRQQDQTSQPTSKGNLRELMRRLAMNEASDDDSQEDISDPPAAKSSRKRSADPGSAQKEQAEEKRRYDADEAEKRHQHELEGRRKKAEEEREKQMFEFFFSHNAYSEKFEGIVSCSN